MPAPVQTEVRLATTGLISVASAPAIIDGVACNPGDRILVRAQVDPVENGIYIWHAAGAPMTLAPDSPRNPVGVLYQQRPAQSTSPPRNDSRSQARTTTMHCKVIDEPAPGTRAVLVTQGDDPSFRFFQGDQAAGTDLVCGRCGRVLAAHLHSSTQVQGAVLKCPTCAAFNDSGRPTN